MISVFWDSGTLFTSYFLSFIIIDQNKNLNILSVSEILLLMIIPGIDMLRLFLVRLSAGKIHLLEIEIIYTIICLKN